MTSGFQINGVDWDDEYVRKDIFTEGGLWISGTDALGYGVLGDNTITPKSSPIQTVAGGTNWKDVDASRYIVMGVKNDGTLWTWGFNYSGNLGDGTRTYRSSPVQTVAGGTDWKKISMGVNSVGAIKTDGTLWAWGDNTVGQLGTNDRVHRSSPVQTVTGGTNWKTLSIGFDAFLAVKTDGTLWVWGRNFAGQLGTNDINHRSSPVQTIAGGTDWKQVSQGTNAAAGIKTDGTLWTWGLNNNGQLGDNTRIHRSSPAQTISGGNNWKQVYSSFMTNVQYAVKTDGTLWGWGEQRFDNTNISRSSPVQIFGGGNDWRSVDDYCAIKTDGTLWAWGNNNYGQFGNGTTGPTYSSPVQILNWTTWKKAKIAIYTFFGIAEDYW